MIDPDATHCPEGHELRFNLRRHQFTEASGRERDNFICRACETARVARHRDAKKHKRLQFKRTWADQVAARNRKQP